MLIIDRRLGDRIVISLPDGGEVVVEVVFMRSDKVKLGVQAPRSVPVWRQELLPLQPEKRDAEAHKDSASQVSAQRQPLERESSSISCREGG